jgi:hypothetical protein
VKHLLMDPAFPDLVGEWALQEIDSRARVWTLTRGADGTLAEEFDLERLLKLNPGQSAEQIADALVVAAGIADIEETRAW